MNFDFRCRNFNPSSPASHPYTSSLSSSASSSSSSVFSVDASSQVSSQSSASSNLSWDSEEPSLSYRNGTQCSLTGPVTLAPPTRAATFPLYQPSACREVAPQRVLPPLLTSDLPVPLDQRQHPRRCSTTLSHRLPPALVRQSERKVNFVDSLVDSATQMVEIIWPLSKPTCPIEVGSGRSVLPLRTFIQETLRRSRTSYSTLQVALYYLILIKSHVPKHDFTMEQPEDRHSLRALQCGRRMFLAALILASKYLQDRNYSARAWSKISGLRVCEINTNEMAFLQAVNWKLHITDPTWDRWQEIVLACTQSSLPSTSPGLSPISVQHTWKSVIPALTPELNTVDIPSTPHTPLRHVASTADIRLQPRSPLGYTSGSCETTPTPTQNKLPRFLEPNPDMLPPTPTLARMGPLPTPTLTPQSAVCITPAASLLNFGSRRPSMCSAMAQAQSTSLARSVVDQWNPLAKLSCLEAQSFTARRPSLTASVASSSSSPESMVSDHSRSSRASSISSVSSSTWAPTQTKLARLATCRSAARLQFPALQTTKECPDIVTSDPMSSPDLESFHLDDDVITVGDDATEDLTIDFSKATKSNNKGRKRCRSSADLSLQQNVRHLLGENKPSCIFSRLSVLPDRTVAQSFALSSQGDTTPTCTGPKALQSPKGTEPEQRLPVPRQLGRKRSCCVREAAQRIVRGPGMWNGIL